MTSAYDITQAVNPPRAVFVNYPLGHQTGKPDDPLEPDHPIQQDRQPDSQNPFYCRGDPSIEKAVPNRIPEDAVSGPEVDIVPEADETHPRPWHPDFFVGEAHPDAPAEGVGDEGENDKGGGQHEEISQDIWPFEEAYGALPGPRSRPDRRWAASGRFLDRHREPGVRHLLSRTLSNLLSHPADLLASDRAPGFQ